MQSSIPKSNQHVRPSHMKVVELTRVMRHQP